MAKDMNISLLFDFYGEILTEKQQDVIDYYYNDDLSLAEISEHLGITRQGVCDSIKRAEATLTKMEEKLGLAKRFREIQRGLDTIISEAHAILLFTEQLFVKSQPILPRLSALQVTLTIKLENI